MDAVERGPEIERARTERIVGPAGHMARQVGPSPQHLCGRCPARPFALGANALDAAPAEAVAPDADAIAQRLAVAQHEVEPTLAGPDYDRAGLVICGEAHGHARDRRAAAATTKAEEAAHRIVAVIRWPELCGCIRACRGHVADDKNNADQQAPNHRDAPRLPRCRTDSKATKSVCRQITKLTRWIAGSGLVLR